MVIATSPLAPDNTRWLSVREASRMLGISQSTLRYWADSGNIRSYRTPGGHRRFAEQDLRTLIQAASPTQASSTGLGDRALARIRRRMTATPQNHSTWAQSFPEAEREHFRTLGRRLVELAGEYLAQPRRRTVLTQEARSIGEEYGATMRRQHFALSHVLEAFIFFRNLVEDASRASSRRDGQHTGNEEGHRLLTALLDHVLLGTVHGYEAAAGLQTPEDISNRTAQVGA